MGAFRGDMLGTSAVFFVIGSFLIFSYNTYGLKNLVKQQILDSGSNLFIKTIPNMSEYINHYQIQKSSLDFKHVSAVMNDQANMPTQLDISQENREPSKAEFRAKGLHKHQSTDKSFHLKQNGRLFDKKQRKKTISKIKEDSISNEEVPDTEKMSGVMDKLWSALNYGSLTEFPKKIGTPPPHTEANYWTVIKEKVHGGVLFVEIGGCLTASSVATDWSSDSVVISLLFKDLYNECISNARDHGLRNFLVGSVSDIQQMVESLSSDKTVAIEHLHLSNLQLLWQSLLPHECEDLLSKLLAISWRVYIVNPANKLENFSPYTHWWANLGAFLQICCQKRNLQCTIDLLHGTNSWESQTVYQVTLKSGYKPSFDINTHILNKRKQMKPSANFLIQDKGDGLISQVNNSYSFAVLTKGVSMSKESLQLLFLLCLQMPASVWNKMMHLPFLILKPFHLHIYWPDPLILKNLIKTETKKYAKADKTHQTFKPHQTPDYEAIGEFWDREIVVNDLYKLANDREVAISNAFWDRDGSFLERKVKKDALPFWGDEIWNRENLEESQKHNIGIFKSGKKFQNHAGNSLLHKSKRDFQISKWRSFQDNNVADLTKGISEIRQKSLATIKGDAFLKTPFFQDFVHKTPSSSFLKKRSLGQEKKLKVLTRKAKLKNLDLSKRLNNIHGSVGPNQDHPWQNTSLAKNNIVLNRINPDNSQMVQQQTIHHNGFRNSIWNKDSFKWNLPRFNSVQLDFNLPVPQIPKYISTKRTRFTENKDNVWYKVRKARPPLKMVWKPKHSKLEESSNKKFYQGQSKDDPATDYKVRIKSNIKDLPKMEEIKVTEENNNGQEKEETQETDRRIYQSHWDAIKWLFEQKGNGNFSLLVYGTKHLTLLAAKTGLLYPHSAILNIVPKLDAYFADMYRNILPPNVLTAINDLDTQIINTVSHLPNMFTFQILGIEIFAKIFWLNEGFITYLGKILSLAQVTVFLVPKPEQFLLAQIILGNINGTKEQNQDFSFENLILKAAATFEGELNIEVIKDDDLSGLLIFVELKHLKKEVIVDCSPGKGILILDSLSSVTAYIQTTNSVIFVDTRTIMLSFLLAFKLRAADKRELFLCYLQLTIYKDMCPHLIFWSAQGLSHSHQQTKWKAQILLTDSSLNLLSKIFIEQLMESSAPFSFLEYQSEGSLIIKLAHLFPNSTFIAVSPDHQTATSIYQKGDTDNLKNLLVTQHPIDDIFTLKLLRSPEFFRYQFLGYQCFLNLASTLSRKRFNFMIGQLLSVSVSTFLILPSEKSLSLGMLTFYPELHSDQWSELGHNSEQNEYSSTNHPSTFYKNAEKKIIFESAWADVQAEVEAITSQHFKLREGNFFPWRLLRVNIKNLTTEVNHHFESHLDGHTRTYIQHCTALGSTNYKVHLQRQSDGLTIPYGNVHAITLIALLRMGLLAEIQKKLYHQFLKLPLYEDMAPWNIVFSAGQLAYIDFDTKNKTFDTVVPMAYQIMSLLMNYERTIRDFGKCRSHAKTQFGFGLISNCVGSDFLGPCTDSLKPVPCGDHTCRSSFIECLRALVKAEKQSK